MMRQRDPAEARRRQRLHPHPARRRPALRRQRQAVRLPFNAPTMIGQYHKDLFEKHGDQMKQDLGFDPTPSTSSTWKEFYKTSSGSRTTPTRPRFPYDHGHQAKQHDSLMNDSSNVLSAYGGDYFKDGDTVGRLRLLGPASRCSTPTRRSRPATSTPLVSIAHPGQRGWDWDGLGGRVRAGRIAMAVTGTSSRPATRTPTSRAGSATRASRAAQAQREHVRGTRDRDRRHVPEEGGEGRLAVRQLGELEGHQLANLSGKVGGGTPTRDSVYKLPEVEEGPQAAVRRCRTSSRPTRCSRPGSPRTSACARRSPPGTSATAAIFTLALEDARRPAGPRRSAWPTPKRASRRAIDQRRRPEETA